MERQHIRQGDVFNFILLWKWRKGRVLVFFPDRQWLSCSPSQGKFIPLPRSQGNEESRYMFYLYLEGWWVESSCSCGSKGAQCRAVCVISVFTWVCFWLCTQASVFSICGNRKPVEKMLQWGDVEETLGQLLCFRYDFKYEMNTQCGNEFFPNSLWIIMYISNQYISIA